MKNNLVFIILTFALLSCHKKSQVNDKPLARVGQEYLYFTDIQHQIPTELSKEDSVAFLESFVQKWVQDKLMYEKALLNLPEDQEDIEEKVEAFKHSLFVYKYEQRLISQKLDRKVSEEEIQSFYNSHKTEFILNEPIVKTYFTKFSKKTTEASKIAQLLNSRKESDQEKFKDFCYQYSPMFFFPDKWMSRSSIANDLPIKNIDINGIVKSKQTVIQQDSLNYYILKVDQYMDAGDVAPLEYVQSDIKQVILQKRTQELNKTVRNKIFDESLKQNGFEIFIKATDAK